MMSRLACLLAVAGAASAQLTLDGNRCGQLTCQLDEYCSPETNRCAPCNIVCNKTHHNYDAGLCIKECQGYLLDLRYMRRTEEAPHADISSVQRLAQTALIVSVLALAVLLLILIILCKGKVSWQYIKQKFQPNNNRVKQYPHELTHHNPHAEAPKPNRDFKLMIKDPAPTPRNSQPLNAKDLETRSSQTEKSQGALTPKTISTAISNRHPAEDTTLDFSYDNMGMNVTPPEQPATSHKF